MYYDFKRDRELKEAQKQIEEDKRSGHRKQYLVDPDLNIILGKASLREINDYKRRREQQEREWEQKKQSGGLGTCAVAVLAVPALMIGIILKVKGIV